MPDVETAGTLAVPIWLAGVGAAVVMVSLLLAIKRAGWRRPDFLAVSRRPDRARRPFLMALCGTARGLYHRLGTAISRRSQGRADGGRDCAGLGVVLP